MTNALELVPEPRSVRRARTWIVEELTTIGRSDLVEAAELGVSELVTNAILHADPPIVVRLAGTPAHPRVEVRDHSVAPPSLREMTADGRLMTTVGRGLGIVAMYSTTWGADVSRRGKVVWFEPAREVAVLTNGVEHPVGEVFDLVERVDEQVATAGEPEDRVTIRLVGMPAQVFADCRTWYEELRRELRLLALNHGADYPVASEVTELTLLVEQERRQARGVDRLDAVLAAGGDRVDLEYHVPATASATITRLRALLEEVDGFCREQWLLTLAPTPQQLALGRWYLGEFERQARGEDPLPWTGGYRVEDPAG